MKMLSNTDLLAPVSPRYPQLFAALSTLAALTHGKLADAT